MLLFEYKKVKASQYKQISVFSQVYLPYTFQLLMLNLPTLLVQEVEQMFVEYD